MFRIPDVTGMTCKEAAHAYLDAGFWPIPVRPNVKAPEYSRGWTYADVPRETHKTIDKWIGSYRVGLIASRRSGIIVVDVDNPEEFESALTDDMPPTASATTSRGYHLFYDGTDCEWPRKGRIPGGDIQSNGFVVVEPSIHHSTGKMYKWDSPEQDVRPIGERDLALIPQVAHSLNGHKKTSDDAVKGLLSAKPGARNNTLRDSVWTLMDSGLSLEMIIALLGPTLRSLRWKPRHGSIENDISDIASRNRTGLSEEEVKDLKDIKKLSRPRESRQESVRAGRTTRAIDIEMKPTYWAWSSNGHRRIPVGELTLIAGHGEAGKSTFNIWLIAQITRGELPGHWDGVPRDCIIAASEDDWEKTIVPRLVAAGANLELVWRFDVITAKTPGGEIISLPRDYSELEAAIEEREAVWVFFDSVVGAIDLKKDINHGQHVRDVLMPLAGIARRQQCVIIGNVHFNKNTAQGAMDRMSGSMEFRNVARAIIYMAIQDDGTGVISKQKNNLGRSWPSLAYDIVEVLVDEEHEITAGLIRVKGETDADAAEIINRRPDRKLSAELQEVMEVLKDLFRNQDTWRVDEAKMELEKARVSMNDKTIIKARERLGIRVERVCVKGQRGVDHYVWTTAKIRVS